MNKRREIKERNEKGEEEGYLALFIVNERERERAILGPDLMNRYSRERSTSGRNEEVENFE